MNQPPSPLNYHCNFKKAISSRRNEDTEELILNFTTMVQSHLEATTSQAISIRDVVDKGCQALVYIDKALQQVEPDPSRTPLSRQRPQQPLEYMVTQPRTKVLHGLMNFFFNRLALSGEDLQMNFNAGDLQRFQEDENLSISSKEYDPYTRFCQLWKVVCGLKHLKWHPDVFAKEEGKDFISFYHEEKENLVAYVRQQVTSYKLQKDGATDEVRAHRMFYAQNYGIQAGPYNGLDPEIKHLPGFFFRKINSTTIERVATFTRLSQATLQYGLQLYAREALFRAIIVSERPTLQQWSVIQTGTKESEWRAELYRRISKLVRYVGISRGQIIPENPFDIPEDGPNDPELLGLETFRTLISCVPGSLKTKQNYAIHNLELAHRMSLHDKIKETLMHNQKNKGVIITPGGVLPRQQELNSQLEIKTLEIMTAIEEVPAFEVEDDLALDASSSMHISESDIRDMIIPYPSINIAAGFPISETLPASVLEESKTDKMGNLVMPSDVNMPALPMTANQKEFAEGRLQELFTEIESLKKRNIKKEFKQAKANLQTMESLNQQLAASNTFDPDLIRYAKEVVETMGEDDLRHEAAPALFNRQLNALEAEQRSLTTKLTQRQPLAFKVKPPKRPQVDDAPELHQAPPEKQ